MAGEGGAFEYVEAAADACDVLRASTRLLVVEERAGIWKGGS